MREERRAARRRPSIQIRHRALVVSKDLFPPHHTRLWLCRTPPFARLGLPAAIQVKSLIGFPTLPFTPQALVYLLEDLRAFMLVEQDQVLLQVHQVPKLDQSKLARQIPSVLPPLLCPHLWVRLKEMHQRKLQLLPIRHLSQHLRTPSCRVSGPPLHKPFQSRTKPTSTLPRRLREPQYRGLLPPVTGRGAERSNGD